MADQTTKRGFGMLPCPLCGAEAVIAVSLDDVSEFCCGECEEPFPRTQVEDFIAKWAHVLSWLDCVPLLS